MSDPQRRIDSPQHGRGPMVVRLGPVRSAQELIQQIAIGRVDFHTIETGFDRILRSLGIGRNNTRKLGDIQCARRFVRDFLKPGITAFTGDGNGRRRNGQHATRLETGMRHATDMPQLQHHFPTGRMHG